MGDIWNGTSAVVTGAASGIGYELARALVLRGVRVWIADIDRERLDVVARSLGAAATPSLLDVRHADAVSELIGRVVRESGRIDYLFNNAGLVLAGEAHEIEASHVERIIDVNIRGVVNGTLAAYPLMVGQGFGHIVNMASLAGIMPSPLLAAYGMTKHAIVGLSTSMRFEAERYGVRISAVCPAGVDTPLLDAAPFQGMNPVAWSPDVRRYLRRLTGTLCSVEDVVREALRGVERNRAIIIIPARARFTDLVYRLAPGIVRAIGRRVLAAELESRRRTEPEDQEGQDSQG
ncbi:MAG: SDR family NAD(P)-dependent oxidoreductase [Chlorobiaceae bacterium]|nr:SDR family NAD(P)-dependent oxidoreductase [Chlorobiaceae bacterium]NTW73290.1 SDR family NAD(P)-dependent oxidoreductase [Chlorobiaceae bacterium]